LTFVYVPDIAADGAFDEAVKGVDGIIHAASPFVLNATDFDKELFQPALNGTLGVLRAAHANAPNVRRVVVTSSFAAVLDYNLGPRPGHVYTEADWNPMLPAEAKDPAAAYLVSKTLAEKAAFQFVQAEKPKFSVTTLAPPMVYGPVEHSVASMDKLNTSSADFWRLINGSEKRVPDTGFFGFADVRDLAQAHLLAYESEKAANERYLITNGPYTYQMFIDIIREKFPDLKDKVPEGNPGAGLPDVYKIDNSKGIKELGIKYKSMEQTVVDTVESLLALEKKLSA
jgi:nucleoside-diphosphate-sugar epimerase